MTEKFQNLIIDCSNLFWRASIIALENQKGQDTILYTKSIEKAFEMIEKKKADYGYRDSKVYLCFDNPESVINQRKLLSGGLYKHHRESKNLPPQMYKALDIFMGLCQYYSDDYYVVISEGLEADDLTDILKDSFKQGEHNLYVSADLDWARNIDEYNHWHNWKEIITQTEFHHRYDFYPTKSKICLYKAIHGDASDCISNAVPYLPKKLLIEVVKSNDTVEEMLDYITRDSFPKQWEDKIYENKQLIRSNYKLVDFFPVDLDYDDIVTKSKASMRMLRPAFKSLSLPLEQRMLPKPKHSMFNIKKMKRADKKNWKRQ